MNVYAESSAVLAWLLGEAAAARVRDVLGQAEIVMASELTLVECERVLVRSVALREASEGEAAARRGRLHKAAVGWRVLRLSRDILERAGRAFPAEPVRTLDALHLASALQAASVVSGLELLSLDERVRRSGEQLGFRTLP